MSDSPSYERLVSLLHEVGVPTVEDRLGVPSGFPVTIPLADGGSLVLDLPSPAFLASLDPDGIGVALLDPLGYARKLWGLANKIPYFRRGQSVLETEIGGILETNYQGSPAVLYLDGYRYFSSSLAGGGVSDTFVLVINANEERMAKQMASKSGRMAHTLKRLGKALTMNPVTNQICLAAAHEIASSADLASVLIWTIDPDDNLLKLSASVGANRQGTGLLGRLNAAGGSSCIAELVATSRQPFFLGSVAHHVMTSQLEAKFCYLKPGGVSVHPLVISDKLLGVLELIGKESDPDFDDNLELFETVTEHLALALNSASMYEYAEKWASHDSLTGLANHRSLHEFLHGRMIEADRSGSELGVMMIDVDHFRSFNEEEGHDAGDEVLRLVAEAIKSCVRPYDLAARYGGEEFTVAMPGSGIASVAAVAERVRARIEEIDYETRSGRRRHVTASIGCASFPGTAIDAPSLLKAADVALYEAKREGRNRVKSFEGAFKLNGVSEGVSLDRILERLPKRQQSKSTALLKRLDSEIDTLSHLLRLSPPQITILRGLILVVDPYQKDKESGAKWVQGLEASEDFRLLAPSLEAIDERFDGKGPSGMKGARIPLLARVLSVMLVIARESGVPLIDDPARFDPEIVGLLGDLGEAAA